MTHTFNPQPKNEGTYHPNSAYMSAMLARHGGGAFFQLRCKQQLKYYAHVLMPVPVAVVVAVPVPVVGWLLQTMALSHTLPVIY